MGPIGLCAKGENLAQGHSAFMQARSVLEEQLQKLGALQCVAGENRNVTYLNNENIVEVQHAIQTMEHEQELLMASEGARASLSAMKAKLGQLYETLVNDAVASALVFHKQVNRAESTEELKALPFRFECLQSQVLRQVNLAVLCNRAKNSGLKHEQQAGHMPVDRPNMAMSHLIAADKLMQKKFSAWLHDIHARLSFHGVV